MRSSSMCTRVGTLCALISIMRCVRWRMPATSSFTKRTATTLWLRTRARNSSKGRLANTVGSAVMTDAEKGWPSMATISPNWLPAGRRAKVSCRPLVV